MKTCPFCAESIDDDVVICPYCDSNVNQPVTRGPSASQDLGDNAAMRMVLPVGRSIWAIAAGYFGLFSLVVFPAPIAVVLGVIAIIDLKKNPKLHGMGRAIFGLVMGLLGSAALLFFVVGLLASG